MDKRIVVFLLILASSLTMMSTDLYAPSLAHLPAFFGTSAANVKLTMSLNTLAYGLATLIHGPLSERFGRRPVLLCGLAGFVLFSFFCANAQTIDQLILARVLQGLCAAVEGVVVLAIIRDLFEEKDQVRVIALYGIATTFTPAVAPVIGAYVHVYFGWRMNFYGLTVIGLFVTILIWYALKESSEQDPHALTLKEIVKDYSGLLLNKQFLKYSVISGVSLGAIFAFITAGPFILINRHGLPTQYFGYFQAVLVVTFILGSLLANQLTRQVETKHILHIGFLGLAAGSLLLLFITCKGNETVLSLAVALSVITFGAGPIFATCPTLAMESSSSRTGSSAAMLIAFEMGIASLAALSVGMLHDGTARPMGMTIAVMTFSAMLMFLIKPKTRQDQVVS